MSGGVRGRGLVTPSYSILMKNGVIYYDGVTFPLEDESMNLVFHREVIERNGNSKCS